MSQVSISLGQQHIKIIQEHAQAQGIEKFSTSLQAMITKFDKMSIALEQLRAFHAEINRAARANPKLKPLADDVQRIVDCLN